MFVGNLSMIPKLSLFLFRRVVSTVNIKIAVKQKGSDNQFQSILTDFCINLERNLTTKFKNTNTCSSLNNSYIF